MAHKEGLELLIGQKVTLCCNDFFYVGILEDVGKTCVKLTTPTLIYEVRSCRFLKGILLEELLLSLDIPIMPDTWYVGLSSIESFGVIVEE